MEVNPNKQSASVLTIYSLAALGCVGIGFVMGSGHYVYFLMAILAIAGIYLILNPKLALLALIPVSMIGNFQEIPDLPFDLGQLFGFVLLLAMVLQYLRRKLLVRRSPLDWPLLLLCIAYLLGLRPHSLDLTTISLVFSFFSILLGYFLCFQLLNSLQKIRTALWVFVGSVTVIACFNIFALIWGQPTWDVFGRRITLYAGWGHLGRIGGFYEQPNAFAQLLALTVPICLALSLQKGIPKRVWWGILAAIHIATLLLTQARSAIVGVIVGIFVILVLLGYRQLVRRLVVVFGIAVIALAVVRISGTAPSVFERLSWTYQEADLVKHDIDSRRTHIFPEAIRSFLENPLGTGFGTGRFIVGTRLGVQEKSVHNIFLGAAVELGVLGLIAWFWLAYAQSRSLFKLANHPPDFAGRPLTAGFLGAIIATWLHNMAHSTLHWLAVWIAFAIASSIVTVYGSNQAQHVGGAHITTRQRGDNKPSAV